MARKRNVVGEGEGHGILTTVDAVNTRTPSVRHGSIPLVIALVVLPGCDTPLKPLPTAPSELTTGITVYEHANFSGRSGHITQDIPDLKDFSGPCEHEEYDSDSSTTRTFFDWNDCISSVRVAPG
jgi:hypothetical protein